MKKTQIDAKTKHPRKLVLTRGTVAKLSSQELAGVGGAAVAASVFCSPLCMQTEQGCYGL